MDVQLNTVVILSLWFVKLSSSYAFVSVTSRHECHSGFWRSVFGWEIPQSEGQPKKHLKYFRKSYIHTHVTPYHRIFKKTHAKVFENVWNFPHVVGSLDGKYFRIVCPIYSGAVFFSYKKYFSVVFQGLVEAYSKLIAVDRGLVREKSDRCTLLDSGLFSFIEGKRIIFQNLNFFLTEMWQLRTQR